MNSNKFRMHQKALIVYSDELFAVLKEALPNTADSSDHPVSGKAIQK